MAIILFCRNGCDLGTHDPIIMMPTRRNMLEKAQQQRREALTPRQPFCNDCGAPTLDSCQHCGSKIADRPRPAYCGQCGKPFPWTERDIALAKAAADETPLSSEDKATLRASVEDLVVNSPGTELAAMRVKRLMRDVTPALRDMFFKIIQNVGTSEALKHLGF